MLNISLNNGGCITIESGELQLLHPTNNVNAMTVTSTLVVNTPSYQIIIIVGLCNYLQKTMEHVDNVEA